MKTTGKKKTVTIRGESALANIVYVYGFMRCSGDKMVGSKNMGTKHPRWVSTSWNGIEYERFEIDASRTCAARIIRRIRSELRSGDLIGLKFFVY